MQRHVLSRAVTGDDGRVYPEGTPLDRIPESNRASVFGTGWTRPDTDRESAGEAVPEQSDGDSDPDAAAVSTAAPGSADTDTAAETPAGDAADESVESSSQATEQPTADVDVAAESASETDDSPAIASLDLAPELVELLAGAGVTTVAEAIAHRTTHGSFRTIKKIGKASDALITAAIDG